MPNWFSAREGTRRRWWRVHDLYAAALVAYLALRLLIGDDLWPIAALNYVPHLLLPLAFLPLPLAVARHRWHSVALEAICAVFFVWVVSGWINGDTDSQGDEPVLTVLTYNLGDGLATPEALVPYLRESGADVIGLVEVTPHVADALASQLGNEYPYQEVRGLGIPGKGLLSRYPIVDAEWLELNPGRPDLRATLDVSGTRVTVFVVHPPPPHLTSTGIQPRPGTEEQFDRLIDLFAQTEGPLLVVGDFNVTPLHDRYHQLESLGLVDVFGAVGEGPGFTVPAAISTDAGPQATPHTFALPPLMRIDYIWVSPEWQPHEAWVGEGAGSDHLPVLGTVSLGS